MNEIQAMIIQIAAVGIILSKMLHDGVVCRVSPNAYRPRDLPQQHTEGVE